MSAGSTRYAFAAQSRIIVDVGRGESSALHEEDSDPKEKDRDCH